MAREDIVLHMCAGSAWISTETCEPERHQVHDLYNKLWS
jgi:hypothetical protein